MQQANSMPHRVAEIAECHDEHQDAHEEHAAAAPEVRLVLLLVLQHVQRCSGRINSSSTWEVRLSLHDAFRAFCVSGDGRG